VTDPSNVPPPPPGSGQMYAAAPPPTASPGTAPRHHGWAIAGVLLAALCLGVLAAVVISQDNSSTSKTDTQPSIDLTQGTVVEQPQQTVTTPPSTVTVQPDVTVQTPTGTTPTDTAPSGGATTGSSTTP
jgi:hypothetical protein